MRALIAAARITADAIFVEKMIARTKRAAVADMHVICIRPAMRLKHAAGSAPMLFTAINALPISIGMRMFKLAHAALAGGFLRILIGVGMGCGITAAGTLMVGCYFSILLPFGMVTRDLAAVGTHAIYIHS